MPSLTQSLETQEKEGLLIAYPLKANVTIFKGALVCVDSTGYLVPASDAANLRFVGVAFETIDNSGGADGAKRARISKRGTFVYHRSGTYTQADVGALVKAVSDHEVAKTSSHNVNVGTVAELIAPDALRIRIDNHTV